MCSIAKCNGVWVATHSKSFLILAVGGKGAAGKALALCEAKWRQKMYGPPGRIPTLKEPNCRPIRKTGKAASRIRRKLECVKKSGGKRCFTGKNKPGGPCGKKR